MNAAFPSVFTIILNWNQAPLTLDCLASLKQSTYPNNSIVLVDNGSTDGSPEQICRHHPEIKMIECGENLGYSEGNNVGIRHALEAGADYIFLLNNDTLIEQGMLGKLVEAAESDPRSGVVGPTMFYFDPPDVLWGGENRIEWGQANATRLGMGDAIEMDKLAAQKPREADYIDSCAVLLKREVLEKVGFLNGDYFINYDDLDLNVRARKAGYRIIYVPSACMWHRVSAAMGIASPATTYYMTRNSLLFFWTHAPGMSRFEALARILLRSSRTISAWSFKKMYQNDTYRRKRAANLLAIRDFFLGRFGKMRPDVVKVCYEEGTA